MRMLKCATALSARLENLRDRRLEAFMRVGDDVLTLAGCTSPARFHGFSARSERTSIHEHRAMQRQGRKLPTKRRAFRRDRSLRPAPPNNVVLESGRIADEALSAAKGRTLSGALKAKMPKASAQTLRSNMKSFSASPPNGALEMTTPTSTTRSSTESQARVVRRGCHTFQ